MLSFSGFYDKNSIILLTCHKKHEFSGFYDNNSIILPIHTHYFLISYFLDLGESHTAPLAFWKKLGLSPQKVGLSHYVTLSSSCLSHLIILI